MAGKAAERVFRQMALALEGVEERAHMGHPDFRVSGKIFATLKGDGARGMVKLTPDQQSQFIERDAAAFSPESGAWGRSGCTRVQLASVDDESLGEAMTLAWRNVVNAAKAPATSSRGRRSTSRAPRRSPQKP